MTSNLQRVNETAHPAAIWAQTAPLDPLQIDCVATVMLKILDNKCKMLPEQQMALVAVYSVIKERKGILLDESIRREIDEALQSGSQISIERIHELRLLAEATIPKQVMKHFKQYFRDSLYGV
jgi:hypothetical protein